MKTDLIFLVTVKALSSFFFLILCIPLWIVKYPAILDFPIHLTRVNIAREIANPLLDYATYYRLSWHLTYRYFDFLTYLIIFIFGVFWAGKITLTLSLPLLLAATRFLLKSVSAPLFPFMLWPLLFAYNWWFWIGSINLLWGNPINRLPPISPFLKAVFVALYSPPLFMV